VKLWMAIICLLWSSSVWAAGAVQIESDAMRMNNEHQRATFTGNVLLTRDDFELRCNQLLVNYVKHKITYAVATGKVRMKQGLKHAFSDKAVFEKNANRVILTGHARVEDEQGVIQGYKIIHDITHRETEVLHQKGQSVHLHINDNAKKGAVQP